MDSFLKQALKTNTYQKKTLTGDGGLRSYTRVQWNKKSGILVCSFEKKQQEIFLLRQKELASISLRVPEVKFIQKNSPYIFLEDLGDTSLEKMVLAKSQRILFYYQQAVDQMLDLQKKAQVFSWGRYSGDLFLEEMLGTKKHLMDGLLNIQIKDFKLSKIIKEWEEMCKTLSSFPYLPAHRDYHSRNLMIKNQKIYIIDFQDSGLFPRFYDLTSLLYDPYASLLDEQRRSVIQYCLSREVPLKHQMLNEFEITVIQRFFKACGNFAGFSVLNHKDTHLKYILPSLNHVKDMLSKVKAYPYFLELIDNLRKEVTHCL